jgi:hypothetical protein
LEQNDPTSVMMYTFSETDHQYEFVMEFREVRWVPIGRTTEEAAMYLYDFYQRGQVEGLTICDSDFDGSCKAYHHVLEYGLSPDTGKLSLSTSTFGGELFIGAAAAHQPVSEVMDLLRETNPSLELALQTAKEYHYPELTRAIQNLANQTCPAELRATRKTVGDYVCETSGQPPVTHFPAMDISCCLPTTLNSQNNVRSTVRAWMMQNELAAKVKFELSGPYEFKDLSLPGDNSYTAKFNQKAKLLTIQPEYGDLKSIRIMSATPQFVTDWLEDMLSPLQITSFVHFEFPSGIARFARNGEGSLGRRAAP